MRLVDAHCHALPTILEPVEALVFQMDANEVENAIIVQVGRQFTQNDYLFDCVRRYPGRFSLVVVPDVTSEGAPAELEELVKRGAVGVRFRAYMRTPGKDPLALWRAADRLGLTVSCGGRIPDFASDEFADLVRTFPNLPIVIEHLASGNFPEADTASPEERRDLFARLAQFPNLYMKIHGLGEFCPRTAPREPLVGEFPFDTPIPPLMEYACETFGPDRLMWGSDFSPVSGREGYRNALRFTLERFGTKSEAERASIFGGLALRLFPVR